MATHDLIRRARLALGMTEQQLADRVGVTRGAVQQWERPDGTAPKRQRLQAVAKALGLTVAELIQGHSDKYPASPPPAAPQSFAMAEPKVEYNTRATRASEAMDLFNQLSDAKQQTALEFLRFLGSGETEAEDPKKNGNGHRFPNGKKAA